VRSGGLKETPQGVLLLTSSDLFARGILLPKFYFRKTPITAEKSMVQALLEIPFGA
jgi:hypothetical protein